jgi:hypothetical protein
MLAFTLEARNSMDKGLSAVSFMFLISLGSSMLYLSKPFSNIYERFISSLALSEFLLIKELIFEEVTLALGRYLVGGMTRVWSVLIKLICEAESLLNS